MCVWEGGLGVDGGWLPLPTRPQLHCDLASLVADTQLYEALSVRLSICLLVRGDQVEKCENTL